MRRERRVLEMNSIKNIKSSSQRLWYIGTLCQTFENSNIFSKHIHEYKHFRSFTCLSLSYSSGHMFPLHISLKHKDIYYVKNFLILQKSNTGIHSYIFPSFLRFTNMKCDMGYDKGIVSIFVQFPRMLSFSGFYNELHSRVVLIST